jgi:hypothetical protein
MRLEPFRWCWDAKGPARRPVLVDRTVAKEARVRRPAERETVAAWQRLCRTEGGQLVETPHCRLPFSSCLGLGQRLGGGTTAHAEFEGQVSASGQPGVASSSASSVLLRAVGGGHQVHGQTLGERQDESEPLEHLSSRWARGQAEVGVGEGTVPHLMEQPFNDLVCLDPVVDARER